MKDERSIANKIMMEIEGVPADAETRNKIQSIIEELTVPLKSALHAVRVDAVECTLADKPRQWFISEWAFQKINVALSGDDTHAQQAAGKEE